MLISLYRPAMVSDWFLENLLVFLFIPILIFTFRRAPLSNTSYVLILVFLSLHEVGAHYKYGYVPAGEWAKPLLHTQRNHFDRLVHFSFGLLLTYPIREILLRKAGLRGFWSYYLPVDAIVALSAIYEMLEAGVGVLISPDAAESFVGMQGDIWDSHKDMGMALCGSVIAISFLAWNRRSEKL